MSKIVNKFLDQAPADTLKGNNLGVTANVTDLTVSQVNTMLGTFANPMTTGGDIIYGGTSGVATRLANGTAGEILTSNGGTSAPSWQPAPGTVSAFFASSQVTTDSTAITSGTFTTFSNSPGFTFTPTITGTYKVYCPISVEVNAISTIAITRIFNTSGGATLLYESQSNASSNGGAFLSSMYSESAYTLTAGTAYVFDIQGLINTGVGGVLTTGAYGAFYMFAQKVS